MLHRSQTLKLLHEANLLKVAEIMKMPIKNKRLIFSILRKHDTKTNVSLFLPASGVTVTEFCVALVLCNDTRRRQRA